MKKPLILDFIEPRKQGGTSRLFYYNQRESLNVIQTKNGIMPFIESGSSSLELETKTRVRQEQDDQNNLFLELETKTKVAGESDDFHGALYNQITKTMVKTERDDEDPHYYK